MIQKVILLSGGRTSARMLDLLIEQNGNLDDFIIAFGNTGKERNETLDFLHEIESRRPIKLVWLEYDRVDASKIPSGVFPTKRRNQNLEKKKSNGDTDHWFRVVDYSSASRNGEPFDKMMNWASVCPNVRARLCSVQLKIRTVMRYLFSIGIAEYAPYIGIRKDEEHRKLEILASADNFEHPQFPMIDAGLTEKDVLEYWKKQPFDLQLESYEGNCDLCFLKAKWKRIRLIQENPEMANWWIGHEQVKSLTTSGDGCSFRRGESYEKLVQLSKTKHWSEFVVKGEKDIACSCAEKAFGGGDDSEL